MREIKFRAWDKEKKRMSKELPLYWPFITWSDGDIEMPTDFALVKDRCEWMQFTGLKDKNGKEIYKGDILCWPKYEGTKNETRWVVEWDNKRAGWSDWSPRDGAEVIGNIYENPELINNL